MKALHLPRSSRRAFWEPALFAVVLLAVLLTLGCSPETKKKGEMFPDMYQEKPVVILVLPPINETTAADAKEYYATTIVEPLSLMGYYILPYEITSDVLKREGIYDTELVTETPLSKFREYFGCDAVLFTTIKKWDVQYLVLSSTLTVSVDCVLKSSTTDRVLWKYNGTVVIDLSGHNSGQSGLGGLIAQAVITAVNTVRADYVPYAKQANALAMDSLPCGKYHTLHGKDEQTDVIVQKEKK